VKLQSKVTWLIWSSSVVFILLISTLGIDLSIKSDEAIGQNRISTGDTTLTAGIGVWLYPIFTLGGGHMRMHEATEANGYGQANGGYIYTASTALRVNLYGPSSVDTSGFTLPSNATFTAIPLVDSVYVLDTGGEGSKVTWGFF